MIWWEITQTVKWGIHAQGLARKAQFGLRIYAHQTKARGLWKGCRSLQKSLSPWDKTAGAFYRALVSGMLWEDPGKRQVSSKIWVSSPMVGWLTQRKGQNTRMTIEVVADFIPTPKSGYKQAQEEDFISCFKPEAILDYDSVFYICSRILTLKSTDFWHRYSYDY